MVLFRTGSNSCLPVRVRKMKKQQQNDIRRVVVF
jgi:hypothetical protein